MDTVYIGNSSSLVGVDGQWLRSLMLFGCKHPPPHPLLCQSNSVISQSEPWWNYILVCLWDWRSRSRNPGRIFSNTVGTRAGEVSTCSLICRPVRAGSHSMRTDNLWKLRLEVSTYQSKQVSASPEPGAEKGTQPLALCGRCCNTQPEWML